MVAQDYDRPRFGLIVVIYNIITLLDVLCHISLGFFFSKSILVLKVRRTSISMSMSMFDISDFHE